MWGSRKISWDGAANKKTIKPISTYFCSKWQLCTSLKLSRLVYELQQIKRFCYPVIQASESWKLWSHLFVLIFQEVEDIIDYLQEQNVVDHKSKEHIMAQVRSHDPSWALVLCNRYMSMMSSTQAQCLTDDPFMGLVIPAGLGDD